MIKQTQRAAMRIHNIADGYQSKPDSTVAGAHKGFEQLAPKFQWDSRTAICHPNNQAAFIFLTRHPYYAATRRMVKRILDQIIQRFGH